MRHSDGRGFCAWDKLNCTCQLNSDCMHRASTAADRDFKKIVLFLILMTTATAPFAFVSNAALVAPGLIIGGFVAFLVTGKFRYVTASTYLMIYIGLAVVLIAVALVEYGVLTGKLDREMRMEFGDYELLFHFRFLWIIYAASYAIYALSLKNLWHRPLLRHHAMLAERTRKFKDSCQRNPVSVAFVTIALISVGWFNLRSPELSEAHATNGTDVFACSTPTHHDGDAIRCSNGPSHRLYGIDAPEMPGSCRPGRDCTPGDPFASRDHLASLTAGKDVQCRAVDTDHYGRQVVQCFVGRLDLSCAMVEDGFAVERYGRLECQSDG